MNQWKSAETIVRADDERAGLRDRQAPPWPPRGRRDREGDFAYFTPYVPHQERNLSESEPQVFLVVRSGNEGHVTKLDGETAERPETVF